MAVAKDTLIGENIESVMNTVLTTYYPTVTGFVGRKFASPFQIGNRFPAILVVKETTGFEERKQGAQRRPQWSLYYYVYTNDDVDEELDELVRYMQGSNDATSAWYGGLKKDQKRGGNAGQTLILTDFRGGQVFAPFGLTTGLVAPYGAGRLLIECRYDELWW